MAFLAALLAIGLTAGCRPEKEIRTYRIAKPQSSNEESPAPAAAKPIERSGEPTDRMLGAILPGPDQAWFFKAVGPRASIDTAVEAVQEFLGTIRFEGSKPVWKLPEGWNERPGGGMRLATLVIPTGESETEMSVIGLGLQDDWNALLLDNVNRWRKQLDQPPLAADDLATATKPLPEVAEGAIAIDELGWFESGGMTPPFAGGLAPVPPANQPTMKQADIPSRPPADGELKQKKPVNWAAGETSAMRKASFVTPGEAKVTAFAFAAAGQMGDPLGNANRWRLEVGLPELTQEELKGETEKIELLGQEGSYFEFVGEEETTYAAMVIRGDLVWFFKLRGPGEAVEAQRDTFREWLGSLSL